MIALEFEDIKTIAELPYNWEKLDNRTIMISGGTGFIGSFISDVFRYRNKHFNSCIRMISLSRRGGESDETVSYIKADISEPFHYDGTVDYVLHLASNTHPKQYEEDPVSTIITNIFGCNNLLKLARELKVKRFLLASSVEIYGQGSEQPMDEKYCGYIDCNSARSGYNEAKRTCETLCQSYRLQYGVDCVILRFARVIGADKKNDSKAMSQFMDKAVADKDIVLKSKGEQRYSFVYIADAVSGLIKALLDGVSGEAYNVAADDEGKTLGGYAEYIAHLAGRKVTYAIEQNDSVSKATFALLHADKLKAIGWIPVYNVSGGLKRTYYIKRDK